MALTKVSRGLISTSIVDNGNATAITIDSSENVSFTGAGTFSGDVTSGAHLVNASSSAFGGGSIQGYNTDFLVDTGQGYTRHNSYYTGGSNHQFLVNETGSTTNAVALSIAKDKTATFGGNVGLPLGAIINFSGRGNITHDASTFDIAFNTNSVANAFVVKGTGDATFNGSITVPSGTTGKIVGADNTSYWLLQSAAAGGASIYLNGGTRVGFESHMQMGAGKYVWRNIAHTVDHMTLDANGKVGIGTNTPAQKLHVEGTGHMFTLENTSTDANQYAQQLFKSGTALNYFWGANQNSTAWGGASSLNIQSSSGAIAFFTSGSTLRMRIHETSGNIDIPNGDITFANGHGIDFSATPNSGTSGTTHTSSLFDDYEEGTWTPILVGTSGTFTQGQQLGSYTKIGNLIHLTFYVGASGLGSATGTINIGNLPYAALGGGTVNQGITTGSCMVDSLPFNAGATMIVPYMSHGATVIQFYQSGSNIGWNTTPADAGFTFIGGISYRTV